MASIRVELELEDGTFTTRMVRAADTVKSFEEQVGKSVVSINRISDSTGNFLGKLRDMTIVLGLAREAFGAVQAATTGWIGEIVKVNAEFERLQVLMRGMSKAEDPFKDATESAGALRKIALDMPFSLKGMTDLFIKMKTTGTDPLQGGFQAMLDSVAAFGGGEAQLKRVGLALQEMSGKGVIQMKELRRQLGDTIPQAIPLMARSLGMTVDSFDALVTKGTLDAKSTLEGFYLEMERVFGGAAQRQMETFNGQMQRTQTLIQNLALTVGNTGFYDKVKEQLTSFNEFLSSETASNYAVQLGQALNRLVDAIQGGVQWLVKMKNELILVAEIIAVGFTARAGLSGLLGLAGMFRELGANITVFRTQMTVLAKDFAGAWTSMGHAMAATNMTGTAQAVAGLAGAFNIAKIGVLGFAAAALPLAIELLPFIIAVGALAAAFGLLSDKAYDGYEAIKNGTGNADDLKNAEKYLKSYQDRIAKLRASSVSRSDKYNNLTKLFFGETTQKEWEDYFGIPALEKAEAEVEEKVRVGRERIAKEQAISGVRTTMAPTEKLLEQVQLGYQKLQTAEDLNYKKSFDAALKNKQDVQALENAHREEVHQNALAADHITLDIMDAAYAKQLELRKAGNEQAIKIQDEYDRQYFDKRKAVADRANKEEERTLGPQLHQKTPKYDELEQKAANLLDQQNAKIAEQQALLAGANGEYAKMAYLIDNAISDKNAVWNTQTQRLKEFRDQLLAAQVQYNELEEAVKGKEAFDRDIQSDYTKNLEKNIELQTRGASGIDKIAVKINEGLYGGKKPIALMAQQFKEIGKSAETAAGSMGKFFSPTMVDTGNSLATIINGIHNDMQGIVGTLDKARSGGPIPLAFKAAAGGAGGAAGGGAAPGAYDPNSNAYLYNLRRAEGNTKNPLSSADGEGQFIASTWGQFLKEMHSELMTGTAERPSSADLALRHNDQLANEAVMWYANQNAGKLDKAGVPVTDANLYLAHFLGPDGAIAALTKSSNTLLASIPKLQPALASNPNIRGMTVADLEKWSQGKFGSGFTAVYGKNAPSQENVQTVLQKGAAIDPNAIVTLRKDIEALRKQATLEGQSAVADYAGKLATNIDKLKEADQGLGKQTNYAKLIADIQNGREGFNNRDSNDPMYDGLKRQAKALDDAAAAMQRHESARQKLQSAQDSLKASSEETAKKLEESEKRIFQPTSIKDTSAYDALEKKIIDLKQQLADLIAEGKDPGQAGRDVIAGYEKMLNDQKKLDVNNVVIAEQEKAKKAVESTMTAEEARQDAYRRQMERLESEKQKAIEVYGLESDQVKKLAETQATYRQQMSQSDPLSKEMKQWGDLGQNLKQNMSSALSSISSNLASFLVTGKANFSSMIQGIAQQLVQTGLNSMISKLLLGSGGAGKLSGGADKLAGAGGGGGKAAVAAHHTGGIAGEVRPTRMIDAMAFMGAKRFHAGGFPGLDPSEVPIIAKKGEEVGWPEQLAKKYGGGAGGGLAQQNTIHINVQGSSGTNQQNQDLADRIAKTIPDHVQSLVNKEIQRQMRPGGYLSNAGASRR